MFPFVGAPMFYSARRRKRKWTLVFCAEGAVVDSDAIQVASSSRSRTSGQEERTAEGDEPEETSFGGGDTSEWRRTIDLGGRYDVDHVSETGVLLPSSSAMASSSTSLRMPSSTAPALTVLQLKSRRRRSSSLPSRGNVRSSVKEDSIHDLPSQLSAAVHAEDLSGSSLECLLERCSSWSFDMFLLNRLSRGDVVVTLGCKIFQTCQFHRVFQLDWTALLLCLRLVQNGYRNNPYHNADHSADVAQAMYCFLQEAQLASTVTPLEKMACILAAFGHDLYHPGVNQKFLEHSGHFLCQLYNNVSVLENFHWRCLVSVIKESSLFDHLPREDWKHMLTIFEVLILATDMQRQQDYLNQFKDFLCTHTCSDMTAESWNKLQLMQPYLERDGQPHLKEFGERLFVMQILIKCADIANPCRPWAISKEWSVRASTEFFSQGDQERILGLPVTNFCDRFGTSVAKIQSGFMEYVAQPLFADWDQYVQSPLSSVMLKNLRRNCQNWNKTLREQVHQQQEHHQRQASPGASPVSSAGISPSQQIVSEASSLEEMAELEMQRPDVLQKRRASSSMLPRSRSPRVSMEHPRRISLPVTSSGGATLWTVSAKSRIYEAVSTSDLANVPVKLQLLHSEVTEEEDEETRRSEDIQEDEGEQQEETSGGSCSGNGCGTPTPPTSMFFPTDAERRSCSATGTDCRASSSSSPQHQQQRRHSEPLVLTLANFRPTSAKLKISFTPRMSKQAVDENGRISNLLLLQRCMPRRGSLPMTQKELEDVKIVGGVSTGPLGARSNSSGPEAVPAVGRAVDVS